MIDQLWPWLMSSTGATVLSLWGAYTGTHSLVSGFRSAPDMKRLIQDIRAMKLQVDQISEHVFVAQKSMVVTSTDSTKSVAPSSSTEGANTVSSEAEKLSKDLRQPILSSAVIWTPERFEKDFKRLPADVLFNVQATKADLVIPSDRDLVPVTFYEDSILYIGWQKRQVLERVFGLTIDELQWTSSSVINPGHVEPTVRFAGKLGTRCPACGTMFRVKPDQIRSREGWLRCGACSTVFNGVEALFDLELDAPTARVPPTKS